MSITQSQIDQLITLVCQSYPGWQNFNHPPFVTAMIDAQQTAVGLLRAQLARTEFERLLRQNLFDEIVNRLEQIAHATNLLDLSQPETSDLRILYTCEPLPGARLLSPRRTLLRRLPPGIAVCPC